MKTLRHLTILLLLYPALGYSQETLNFENFETDVARLLSSGQLPSVVVAVVKEGQIIYEKAFGFSDVAAQVNATTDTPYPLASVTKTMTATAILILVENGKLHLDTDIFKYLPEGVLRERFRESGIQLKHLLNHTSGLSTYFDIGYADEKEQPNSFTEAAERYAKPMLPKQTVSEYSNLGYGLLGLIIENSTSLPYAKAMKQLLFDPLKMKHSFIASGKRKQLSATAKHYTSDGVELPELYTNTPAAGDGYASIHDLIRFGSFHLNNNAEQVLSEKSISKMQDFKEKEVLFPYHKDAFYCLGWYVKENDKGHKTVWHEGGMMGTSAMLKLIPDQNIAIAVILNTSDRGTCNALVNTLSNIVLPDYHPNPINEMSEITNFTSFTSDTSYLGEWKGTIQVENQKVPLSLALEEDGTATIRYLDETYSSYFTKDNPLWHTTVLNAAIVNNNYFIGLFPGNLNSEDLRPAYNHLLSMKLYKEGASLSGFITALPAASREYYARSFYIQLTKQ